MRTIQRVAITAMLATFSAFGSPQCVKQCLRAASVELKPLPFQQAGKYEKGFETNSACEFICDNGTNTKGACGVSWYLRLDQQKPATIIVSGEALAEKADAAESNDFSIYLDIQFMDGTFQWGQVAPFNPQKKGWQQQEVWFAPAKPIKSVNVYLLYRNRPGRVRFRNARYGTMPTTNAALFDGASVKLAAAPKEGFLLRDVAANGDFFFVPPEDYGREANGFPSLTCSETDGKDGARFFEVALSSSAKEDRAVTLYYSVPVKADCWFDGSLRLIPRENMAGEQIDASSRDVGSNGWLSRYPFAALESGGKGIGIGIDPATPAYYRIVYHPSSEEFSIAFDIGLAPEMPKAKVRFCTFTFDAAQGFRGALAAYYRLYPAAFATRISRQGLWMPFAPISKVQGWEDFAFRFKEGNDEPAWDDAHGVVTFRYTEPMTWWMSIPTNEAYTLSNAVAIAERKAAAGDKASQAWKASVFQKEDGSFAGRVEYTPWCNGIVWSVNDAPSLAGGITDFTCKWNPDYVAKTYGKPAPAGCDGEYIDSAEAYVTDELDFRRDHFSAMKTPLCFSRRTRRVGIYKGMIGFEYVRFLSEEMHRMGRFMMANSTPIDWMWLAPLLDVMGTETNWKHNGHWNPMGMEEMFYRRALCRGKPYCYLMNTDFTKWTYEDTEKYMKRSLAFGFFPGFFSANASTEQYFANPKLYNRDRPLFKKYLPVIRRIAEAGWEPVANVKPDNESLHVERFGMPSGVCCITVYNASAKEESATLTQTLQAGTLSVRDMFSGQTLSWPPSGLRVTIPAGDVRAFEIIAQ